MKVALVAALALSLLVSSCGAGTPPPSAPSPLLNKAVPSFKRPTLDGAMFDTAQVQGKLMVIKFFAKYCEPCKRTLPRAEQLHQARPDIAFVGVSEDESENDAREVRDHYGLTFPIVMDRGNVLSGRYRVTEMPVTFVVARDGKVLWVGGPEQNDDDLQRAIP